jgi:catechol 2,3-dioxygenase-like lactoylglutathione lyase family enzyme
MADAYTAPLPVQLFHYHLVTRKPREVEARYVAKLGFELVARHGRIDDRPASFEPGVSWEQLDARGFRLRLSELERGAVNVVVQPGQWVLPRVDHLGVVLDEDAYAEALERAAARGLRVQDRQGRRTFVATGTGYRLELHPPRDWIEDLLEHTDELRLAELHLLADDPDAKAHSLAELLDLDARRGSVELGDTVVRFLPGGPPGRPELHAELFL